jgi:hypothetical protein
MVGAHAQFVSPETIDWHKVRAAQPEGLSLHLEVPKSSYHQGEIIEATLTFRNSSSQPYHLWAGTYDRSGRIPDIVFHAVDAEGKPVPDPLRWYFERGGMGGGLGNTRDLGEWKITLSANQWLRFDRPGTYTLRAFSNRVRKGDQFERGNQGIELVSDPVTLTMTTLRPADEHRLIGRAVTQLNAGGEEAATGAATLRFLGRPASRAALLPVLSSPGLSHEAAFAFYAAPHPADEAPAILEAVRTGKIKFDPGLTHTYATLKTADFRFHPLPKTPEEQEALVKKFQSAFQAATGEITAAATAASGGRGPDFYQTIITTLFQDPVNRPKARAELVKVQLDLTPEQADTILRNWQNFGGEDFLPLVRKMVGAPAYNSHALKALAEIQPHEARPLIVEDIQREEPRYLVPKAASRIANAPLLSLPARPIPELEAYFQEQLSKEHPPQLDLVMDAINRYGSPKLLPALIDFYRPKEGRWACDIQTNVLQFWLRHDPPAGVEALKRALAAREHTRCYTNVLSEVLITEWNEAALPVVVAALDDPDPEVALSAIPVLEAHADASHLGSALATLQRAASAATGENMRVYYATHNAAQKLQRGTRWKLDESQKQQLAEIANSRPR